MNINLIQTLTSRIPGVLSGVPTLSQITPETADSVQNFNASLTDWKERAASWQQQTAFLTDVEWLMEHRADEIADAAQQLRFDQFELVRELIKLHRQRAALVDVMQADLAAAEIDAQKKYESAKNDTEKKLSKILPNTGPREKVLFNQAINSSESVATAAKKLREVRGHLSALAEMKRPLAANEEKLCELLTEAARELAE